MRIRLDERLDGRLSGDFEAGVEVSTVARAGWQGMKNGEFLRRAAEAFEGLVPMDKGIPYQQNPRNAARSVISISAKSSRLEDVRPALPRVNTARRALEPGQVRSVRHATTSE